MGIDFDPEPHKPDESGDILPRVVRIRGPSIGKSHAIYQVRIVHSLSNLIPAAREHSSIIT